MLSPSIGRLSSANKVGFDVRVTLHRRHSEGKEPTRCEKVCSFIASTCFGHLYVRRQEYCNGGDLVSGRWCQPSSNKPAPN
jgi:hypothetical protein